MIQVKKIVKPTSVGSYLFSSSPSTALSFTGNGDTEITALRTWKQLSEDNQDLDYDSNSIQGIYSVRTWYDTMFSKAKESIYMEDQFPFQDEAITKILINRLREQKDLKISRLDLWSQIFQD